MRTDTDIKQTRPAEIEDYGTAAIGYFDRIEADLILLCNAAAKLPYSGERAVEFKEALCANVQNFSTTACTNMGHMAMAISKGTSFISEALGGAGLDLKPPTSNVTIPTAENVAGEYSATKSVLDTFRGNFEEGFSRVMTEFQTNMSSFESLGDTGAWIGEEFNATWVVFDEMTNDPEVGVLKACEDSKAAVIAAVDAQLKDLGFI